MRNPILKKELVLGARTIKLPFALMVYSGVMSGIAVGVLAGITSEFRYRNGVDFESLISIFLILACTQIVIIGLMLPVLTAGSIAGERERQTLDIMLTAPISSLTIVTGKLLSSMAHILLFVISAMPAMAVSFIYGGIEWKYLFIFFGMTLCVAFWGGAIGVYCSAAYKKTMLSIVMALALEFIMVVGTVGVVLGIYFLQYLQNAQNEIYSSSAIYIGFWPLIVLLNPAVAFGNAMYEAYSGQNFVKMILEGSDFGRCAEFVKMIAPHWTLISVIAVLATGMLFTVLAARKVDQVHLKEKKLSPKGEKKRKKAKA